MWNFKMENKEAHSVIQHWLSGVPKINMKSQTWKFCIWIFTHEKEVLAWNIG